VRFEVLTAMTRNKSNTAAFEGVSPSSSGSNGKPRKKHLSSLKEIVARFMQDKPTHPDAHGGAMLKCGSSRGQLGSSGSSGSLL
jgi:hypothetical protein